MSTLGDSRKLFLVTGMSRAGTEWLVKSLNLHPDIVAYGESCFWGRLYIEPNEDGYYYESQLKQILERQIDNKMGPRGRGKGALREETIEEMPQIIRRAVGGLKPPILPVDVFLSMNQAMCEAEHKSIAVEKTPHHLNWLDRILEASPNAKIIIMTRGPYDFMLSYKYQGAHNRPEVREIFRRAYHPFLAAMVWRGYIRSVNHALREYPDNVMQIKMEQVADSPALIMRSVLEFFNISLAQEAKYVERDNSSFLGKTERPPLMPEDIFWLNMLARREITENGHEIAVVPSALWRILWSFIRLPVWAGRNLITLRKKVPGPFIGYIARWLRAPSSN